MEAKISKSLDETAEIAANFLVKLKTGNTATVVALFGDLGAGKTAFVKKCAEYFGISDTVISPTFIIEKIYKIPKGHNQNFKHLVHIDAYRFENEEEANHIGFEELSHDAENIIFIEWPEKMQNLLPQKLSKIYFEFIDENSRSIEIKK